VLDGNSDSEESVEVTEFEVIQDGKNKFGISTT